MTILHVTPYYPPAWAFGPTPAAVAALARAQAEQGHTVIVLTTDAMAPHERLNAGDALVDGVRVVRVRNLSGATRTWLGCSTPIGLRHAARRLAASGIDVVHLHELVTVENLRVLPAIQPRVPVVVSLHGQLRHQGRLPHGVARAWRLLGGQRLCARIGYVSASTPEERSDAQARAASLCPGLVDTVVMADGIDTGGPSGAPSEPADGVRVLVDGRTDKPDAVAAIVRGVAALQVGHHSLHLVVTGPESLALTAAREAARLNGVESRVLFSGYVPPSRMRQWLDQSTLLLLPSGHIGSGALIVDALARGVAVLTPDPPLPVESPALIRPVDTEAGWARAIGATLETDASQRRQSAVASVEPLLWPAVARRWVRVYEDLQRSAS